MAGKCSKRHCYPDSGCNYEGYDILTECPHYNKGVAAEQTALSKEDGSYWIRMPWTGNTMGTQDLNYLSAMSPVTLIGIAGVASAGKTTFLATLYCLLRRGLKIGSYQFAGSFTLTGWENIAWYLSWKDHSSIQFPPHTSSNAGRIPGLLHITLRNDKGRKIELVFTDAPGEWFDHWTTSTQHESAQGAVWIHQRADAFLLFADCEMLADFEHLGKARQQIKQVADRLKYALGERPLGLIWAKSDISLEEQVKKGISHYLTNSPVKHYQEFEASVRGGENDTLHVNILHSIEWIINVSEAKQNEPLTIKRYVPSDGFLSKR